MKIGSKGTQDTTPVVDCICKITYYSSTRRTVYTRFSGGIWYETHYTAEKAKHPRYKSVDLYIQNFEWEIVEYLDIPEEKPQNTSIETTKEIPMQNKPGQDYTEVLKALLEDPQAKFEYQGEMVSIWYPTTSPYSWMAKNVPVRVKKGPIVEKLSAYSYKAGQYVHLNVTVDPYTKEILEVKQALSV